jgi:tRNA(adenine34) deaminase
MELNQNHEKWMLEAFREAEKAFEEGEVPVGAVVVLENRMIGKGHNRVEGLRDATAHAEILAITAASNTISTWRLDHATLYVTLEPCVMCAGAIMNSRIKRIVYGASDPKAGACGSVFNLTNEPNVLHHVDVTAGVFKTQCGSILRSFFQIKRES